MAKLNYSMFFLQQFTKELILNSAPTYMTKKYAEERKEINEVERAIEEEIESPMTIAPRVVRVREYMEREDERILKPKVQENREFNDSLDLSGMQRSIMEPTNELMHPNRFMPERRQVQNEEVPFMETASSGVFVTKKEYPNEGFYLGGIERLVKDINVSTIECPGADKHISVKTGSRMMPTRIVLEAEEIDAIINSFSREARIPRIGGVFKAIVNNLIITAIDNDLTGSRFIITKIHPHQSQFL